MVLKLFAQDVSDNIDAPDAILSLPLIPSERSSNSLKIDPIL